MADLVHRRPARPHRDAVRRADAASTGQRRRSAGLRRSARRPTRDRSSHADVLSRPSSSRVTALRRRGNAGSGPGTNLPAATRLPRLHGVDEPGAPRADGFGRHPGRDDDARRALPDPARHDGASRHGDPRHESCDRDLREDDRERSPPHPGASAAPGRAPPAVGRRRRASDRTDPPGGASGSSRPGAGVDGAGAGALGKRRVTTSPRREWWRPQAALPAGIPATTPAHADPAAPDSPIPFWALMAFTAMMLLAPHNYFPGLAPSRLASLAAGRRPGSYVVARLRRGQPLTLLSPEIRIVGALLR